MAAAPEAAAGDGVAAAPPFDLVVRTLGGSELRLPGVTAETSLLATRVQLGGLLGAPPFTLELLSGARRLEGDGCSLGDLGVVPPEAALVLVRRPGEREDYAALFGQLLAAIRAGRSEEARALIDQGAGLDAEGELLRVLPGHEGGGRGAEQPAVEALAGADEPSCTMLHLAVREGLADLALFLLRRGGLDADARNENGRTALAQAAIRGLAPVVDALLAAGADAGARDHSDRSAFFYALRRADDEVASRLLVASSYDSEKDAFGFHGAEPLLFCIERGMSATAVALLEGGMPFVATSDDARTALHRARACGMDVVVDALSAKGCRSSACCVM